MRKINNKGAKVFTFLLCLSLLTGCSGGSDNGNGGNSTASPTQATAITETDSQNKDNKSEKDDNSQSGTENKDEENKSADVQTDNNESGDKSDTSEGKSGDNESGNAGNTQIDNQSDVLPEEAAKIDYKPFEIEYKNKDLETSYVPGDCTSIVFSDNNINVVGKETEISNVNGRQVVKIIKKGDYLISGSCSNGQIIVEANKEKDVRLILNGVNLTCTDSAPIYEKQCDKMVITLADGTENILSDTSEYVYDDAEKKQPDAVIFAKDDLVINGNGILKVNSVYSEGIHSTDSVKLISGNIFVNSGDNGVRGKEGVIIKAPVLNIAAKGDGLKTTYSDNTSLGYVIIEGGKISITSAKDGIQATGHVQITGGDIDITTDNGFAHADSEDSKSAKGIKSDNDIYIKDGNITINSTDDAINNNGSIAILSGTHNISAVDDGIHSDGKFILTGGTVTIHESKEGIDAKSVVISGGNASVISDDDGIKASSDKDEDDDAKVIFGEADPFAVSKDVYVAITGGTVYVKTDADCIDSDGNLYITGGSIVLDGAKAKEDGAVSYNGTAVITGGSIEVSGVGDISQKILQKTE